MDTVGAEAGSRIAASSRLANVAANSPCAFDRPEKAESERNKREVGAPSLSARGVPKSQERGVAVLVDERGVENGHSSKSSAIGDAQAQFFGVQQPVK